MNIYKSSMLVVSALVFSACETVIDIDLPLEPTRLVVNSFISPDSTIGVRISKSKYVLDRANSFILVNDAQVILLEDGQEVTQLTTEGEGWYTSSFLPQAGHRYTLRASAKGLETVEASSEISAVTPIIELTADTTLTENGLICTDGDCETIYATEFRFKLRFTDAGSRNNFYEILGYTTVSDSFPTSKMDEHGNPVFQASPQRYRTTFSTSDPVVSNPGLSIEGDSFYGRSLLFTDEVFSGQDYTVDFSTADTWYQKVTQITVVLRTLSEDQYLYLRSRALQASNEGDPFSEVVPVYNNIQNGFGIFAGYSADSVVVAVE